VADKVIRTGDSLFGSAVTAIGFDGELNANGDIPFIYVLANGSAGIAVAPAAAKRSAADYVVWRKGMGTTYNQNDYGVWRAHFRDSLGPGSGSVLSSAKPPSSAPEPASASMLLLCGAAIGIGKIGRVAMRVSSTQNRVTLANN